MTPIHPTRDVAKLRKECPECHKPLSHAINILVGGASEHIVFCPSGTCASQKANDGARAPTYDEAFKMLEEAVISEMSEQNEKET